MTDPSASALSRQTECERKVAELTAKIALRDRELIEMSRLLTKAQARRPITQCPVTQGYCDSPDCAVECNYRRRRTADDALNPHDVASALPPLQERERQARLDAFRTKYFSTPPADISQLAADAMIVVIDQEARANEASSAPARLREVEAEQGVAFCSHCDWHVSYEVGSERQAEAGIELAEHAATCAANPLVKALKQAEASLASLREYARHKDGCHAYYNDGPNGRRAEGAPLFPCKCGLDKVLAALSGSGTKP